MKRSAFTLIEMMIVMSILALALTVTGFQVSKFLQEQRFLSEVHHVVRALQSAQDLMLVLGLDVQLKIAKDPEENGIIYGFELETKAQKSWEKLIKRPNKPLKYIRTITFESADHGQESSDSSIVLNFPSGGVSMSKGLLILKGTSQQERKIVLRGYPYPFDSKYQESSSPDSVEERREDQALKYALMQLLGMEHEEKK